MKKETKEKMRNKGYALALLKEPFQIIDMSILTLKWALGYKVAYKGELYWCYGCSLMHKGLQCPSCGNAKDMCEGD